MTKVALRNVCTYYEYCGITLFDPAECAMKRLPNPIDKHVGARVRMRRNMLGMSQEKLADALGVTFQQVQKYEKGSNRIGASRLQDISKSLQVPPSFFFDGAPAGDSPSPMGFQDDGGARYITDFLSTAEGLQLNKAFARIEDPKIRRRILELVISLAPAEDGEASSAGLKSQS